MNTTDNTGIRALSHTEMDEVSGGVAFAGAITAGLAAIATTATPKLALRIITEVEERKSQVIQKATS